MCGKSLGPLQQMGRNSFLYATLVSSITFVLLWSCNVNVNVNVISRTALIRNRVSRRVLHVSKITWGVLYLFQEAQTHWLPVLGVQPRVVPYTWPVLKCCAI